MTCIGKTKQKSYRGSWNFETSTPKKSPKSILSLRGVSILIYVRTSKVESEQNSRMVLSNDEPKDRLE